MGIPASLPCRTAIKRRGRPRNYDAHSADAVVHIDWVTIGDPGNPLDQITNRGSVAYTYLISRTEVTNAQYTEFLNAVENRPSCTNRLPTRILAHIDVSGTTELGRIGRESEPY